MAALYGPNTDSPEFFTNLKENLINWELSNEPIILCGDWNVVLNSEKDTINYLRENNPNARKSLSDLINTLDLEDVYREREPNGRGYTWSSYSNLKQARLDYFLVSSDLTGLVESIETKVGYRTDHALVIMNMIFTHQVRGRGFWKFNNSLLSDSEYVRLVKECIKETIDDYKINGDLEHPQSNIFSINDQLLFETLKLQIRGKTISYAAWKKKEQNKAEQLLENEINDLQQKFNGFPLEEIKKKLVQKQNELQNLREHKMRGIAIPKANWITNGEKNTKYFLNLEKRHYTNKLIPKLILENATEITNQEDIIKEQERFYGSLYTSRKTQFRADHLSTFFSRDNIRPKLTPDEMVSCEGKISVKECLDALKAMGDGKSPGMDGFTAEFYKFFWNDLSHYLVRSINFSYTIGEMSVTQRSALITILPKPNKQKFYLKNWRPISLLGVDYKIASAVIANRIKKVLPSIISHTQKGFLKNRSIAENTRLIYDIIDKLNSNNQEGLLLLIDFEKAFDSVEWTFLDEALKFFNFGEFIRHWVKTFYNNINSSILYNGHCSNSFSVTRGVRQGDPLSPYLFIICAELLADAIKQNSQIKGITVNNEEFVLGQYADDTFFLLDGAQSSLSQCLNTLELFGECSGLKMNTEKTKAVWLGRKRFSKDILLPDINLAWIFNEPFEILGITFFTETQRTAEYNYKIKLEEVRKLLDSWAWRFLSILGKIQVIKSLAISKFVHLLTALPTPGEPFLKELETLFFSFIWSGKRDKVARKTIINDVENGGLKMTDIRSFAKALKISWIKKVWDVNYQADWKRLLTSDCFYWEDVWLLNKKSLFVFGSSFMQNVFWRDVVESWAEYVREPVEARDFLSQPLWNNVFIKIENKPVFYKSWYMKNLRYVNDLVDESGFFLSPTELISKFNLKSNFLNVYGVMCAIPNSWKTEIRDYGKKLQAVSSHSIEGLFKTKRVTSFTYDFLRKSIALQPAKVQRKWNSLLPSSVNDWTTYYIIPFLCTSASKLRSFQYRIFHRIIGTNTMLMKIGIRDQDECFFCDKKPETIEHLFWYCDRICPLWNDLSNWICEQTKIKIAFSLESVLLGYTGCMPYNNAINCIILVVKFFIYKCKMERRFPDFPGIQSYLKYHYTIEKFACSFYHQDKILSKWRQMEKLFH